MLNFIKAILTSNDGTPPVPIPAPRDWGAAPGIARLIAQLKRTDADFRATLARLATHCGPLAALPHERPDPARPRLPHWLNSWMPPLDGMTIFGLLAEHRPARYIEIGSGFSTMYARHAIQSFKLPTKIVSIDPAPRAEIDALCDETMRQRCEDVPLSFWQGLQADDMLFVDNSHRAYMNSDVTCFFSDILGCIKPGSIYGLHDIFLPDDYPKDFAGHHYNEQYLLLAYLLGGADGDTILLPNAYLSKRPDLLQPIRAPIRHLAGGRFWVHGGAFWMRRGGR